MNARFPDGFEMRVGAEIRAAGRRLEGFAARFGVSARIGNAFSESIAPTAFTRSLSAPGADVLALVDHDPSKLLGRTSSGTLRLSADATGLAFSVDVPDTQIGHDVLALAQRGDLGGMSFGFMVPKGGDAWPAADQRILNNVDLREISVVHSWPAYPQTSVIPRSRQAASDYLARRRWLESV